MDRRDFLARLGILAAGAALLPKGRSMVGWTRALESGSGEYDWFEIYVDPYLTDPNAWYLDGSGLYIHQHLARPYRVIPWTAEISSNS